MNPLLSFQHVKKVDNGLSLLQDINFCIKKNEIYELVVSDKSLGLMIIRLALGLTNPSTGKITYDGHLMSAVFSGTDGLYPQLTAYENLLYENKIHLQERNRSEIIQGFLALGELEYAGNTLVSTYSIGMKKRLSVLKSLLATPDLLILERPFDDIDSESELILCKLLEEVSTYSTIMIVSSGNGSMQSLCTQIIDIA
jgi:ABC-type multidrug transport system ATPase subunit